MSERALFRILFVVLLAGAVVVGFALWFLGTTDEHRTPRQSGETSWTTVPDDSAETMSPQPAPLVIPTTYPPRPAVDVPSALASTAVKLATKTKATHRATKRPIRRPTTKAPAIGSGTPGAFCATSRLGSTFVRSGHTYVCKGPKPYRWRRA